MNSTLTPRALLLLAVVLGTTTAAADDAPKTTSTIRVNVGTLRSHKGALGCRLFASGAGFPESSAGAIERRVPAKGDVVQCVFENVAPGTYAVAAMHDENDNRKLDKNFLGVPTEGYGVSNNHTYALSNPKWSESTFVVTSGKDVGLGVALRY